MDNRNCRLLRVAPAGRQIGIPQAMYRSGRPIFGVADYGIAEDLFQIVPALTEQFRKRLR